MIIERRRRVGRHCGIVIDQSTKSSSDHTLFVTPAAVAGSSATAGSPSATPLLYGGRLHAKGDAEFVCFDTSGPPAADAIDAASHHEVTKPTKRCSRITHGVAKRRLS